MITLGAGVLVSEDSDTRASRVASRTRSHSAQELLVSEAETLVHTVCRMPRALKHHNHAQRWSC
jgi:hypothetical protein